MFDPWAPEHSTLREKVAEHLFIAELSRTLLLDFRTPCEVLRSECDAFGHDIVIEANGIMRHVQLKTLKKGGKTARVNIQLALASKPGGCVIWQVIDPATLLPVSYLWFGGEPGQPLPDLGDRIVRNSRANASGVKTERSDLRSLRKGRFTPVETIAELAQVMFGLS